VTLNQLRTFCASGAIVRAILDFARDRSIDLASHIPSDMQQAIRFARRLAVIGRVSLSDESLEQILTLLSTRFDVVCANYVSAKPETFRSELVEFL
jgi:hypothetical protein